MSEIDFLKYDSLSQIQKITLKNQINKIINAYKKYKIKSSAKNSFQYQITNEILTTDISPSHIKNKIEYIGGRDDKGSKSG